MDYERIIGFAQTLDNSRESLEKLYDFLLEAFNLEKPPEASYERRGKLIALDGHSGAGKDTQMEVLKQHMKIDKLYEGFNVIDFVQKRNDPFRQVSKYLWANRKLFHNTDCSFLLLTAGRRYFVETMVSPMLEAAGTIIIQNRSYLSNAAYHASDAGELPALLELCDFDPEADLPFILTCDVEIAFERIKKRSPEKGGIIYPNERPEYISRVRRNFEGLGNLVKGLIYIDSSGDVGSVGQEIKNYVSEYFQGVIK